MKISLVFLELLITVAALSTHKNEVKYLVMHSIEN
jgi:hypothetical protein